MRSLIRSRRVALPLAALALTGTGVAAYGAVADDGVDYRTVAATTGSVEQELSLSGVISPSGRSDLAFGTDGTVSRVRVAQGDEVEEGDVIAVLDRASLRAAVDRARSELATATARLADDRDAQTTAVSTASSSSSSGSGSSDRSTSGTPSTGGSGSTSGATAALVRTLSDQQDAVVAAQSAAGDALATAGTALSDQQAACADPVTSPTETATDATDGTDGTDGTETTSTTAVLSEACTTALTTVQSAQAAASDEQTALQTALETLGGTLADALGSVQSGSSTPSSAQPTAAAPAESAASSAASASTPSGGGAGQTVTAATLAQDQASIDRARADLVAAKADLAGAVVRAPADGTVVSLAVATNADVAAGDTVATVVAPGLTTVAADVSATQAAQLEQGTDVEMTPAGATEVLAGSISRVEHVASGDATGSAPTYAVEIVLDERDLQLADGMPASVTVVVGSAEGVVVVPASAVDDGSVTVLDDEGRAQRVRVTTGIVGATQIEVTDGLEDGDVVVLADLDAELPTGGSDQQTGLGGGGFGGGGGGFPAGGPPSGGGFPGR